MSVGTQARGLLILARKKPLQAAGVVMSAIVWAVGTGYFFSLTVPNPDAVTLLAKVGDWSVRLGLSACEGVSTAFVLFVSGGFLFLVLKEINGTLVPWVKLKLRTEGRAKLAAEARAMNARKAQASAQARAQNADDQAKHEQSMRASLIIAAENYYQARGVNMLDSYVAAEALADQVWEETAKAEVQA